MKKIFGLFALLTTLMLNGCADRAGASDLVGKNISVAISRYGQAVKVERTDNPDVDLVYFDKDNGTYLSNKQVGQDVSFSGGQPVINKYYDNQWKKNSCTIGVYVNKSTRIINDYKVWGCAPEWAREMF
ncbi:hypothetical protein [Pantoea allii]|jgi:hypothetical protein|uniref:hypothetical protein n=1 Tax=Pantoea allii TaxID=574096 RepID=UPI000FFC632A|nr:hypothetical protein [Pantoea allii]MBW1252271.1 hypothetical protein [Pantoea allii]MBW1261550.1 hypothetical protein [Pantoea allii]MBW1283790.1 hypothetical protein [Pantoea allii]NQS86966.1 hypothetical protein [Pantoea allii]